VLGRRDRDQQAAALTLGKKQSRAIVQQRGEGGDRRAGRDVVLADADHVAASKERPCHRWPSLDERTSGQTAKQPLPAHGDKGVPPRHGRPRVGQLVGDGCE
jgi:hypothetical protein